MLENDPLWYKDAIIYELHVRSFHDSVGDGMGDFRGLTQKLDYLQDLGVTAIWLLPFYPSPLKDDGYDIAHYTDIHPHYGKLRDFQEFLDAAHHRGLRVITELVINHTSDQHPWFQRARRAPPGSPERDFYVWSDTPEKYREARIIFQDFEHSNWSWDPLAKAYYWHRFYAHQPDLNFDNPAVWEALFPVVDFWFERGVDGMRLDAVPYLFEREGTGCENLPETHAFLKALRRHVDSRYRHRMLLAEANQWPEDAVAYFGEGDECHMAFHFPLMPRMFMAIHMEDRFPIIDILAQTPVIPDACQWSLFLRNHDELTLEMVTDEERDYMYRAYAGDARARVNLGIRRRLAPLLGNNRRRIELMKGLLFSLPGTPVIYYGDEIGMGDNIYLGDRNGVRTPMQWSADRNAGFSRANPQRLFLPVIIDPEYHYEAVNVEAQQNNTSSLLWWMKRLIALRKRYKAFGRGSLEFLQPANRKILAFVRQYQQECILVVANLSRFVQYVELDLAGYAGLIPVELFGHNALPAITKQPYPLTLGPHSFYWFALERAHPGRPGEPFSPAERSVPALAAPESWEDLFQYPQKRFLEAILPRYLSSMRWLGERADRVQSAMIREALRVPYADRLAFWCFVDVEYAEGPWDTLALPLAFSAGEQASRLQAASPQAVVARVQVGTEGLLYDALYDPAFREAMVRAVAEGRAYSIGDGYLAGVACAGAGAGAPLGGEALSSALCGEEQANTSVLFADRMILKVFRKVEAGTHPEVECGRYLSEKAAFAQVAPLWGYLEYRTRKAESISLAVLHKYVANEGTAWQYALDELSRYFERVLALPPAERQVPIAPSRLGSLAGAAVPEAMQELMGRHLELAGLLGLRTAELHLSLASAADEPAFAPEPFTRLYQRSIYQSMRNAHRRAFDRLRQRLACLSAAVQNEARPALEAADRVLERFRSLLVRRFWGQRIRIHGAYDLCEVLFTGKDFVVIDFGGEDGRSLGDRRVKRSPLRDAASMIISFYYAAHAALLGEGNARGRMPGIIRPEDAPALQPWAHAWYVWSAAAFLGTYLAKLQDYDLLPRDPDELHELLDLFLLERALHELRHDLAARPHWAGIPLRAVLELARPGPT
jgi:maltose alpha-D-glucosyltransferase/alpha-amylase